jgi:catechol 2,3-dioxygenase-like lactoylglutathione lyase family enzyme/ribosome-associated toxin RatA of RatAB toxin-antitoxin module
MGELKAKDEVILNYPVDYVYRTVTDIANYDKWWPREVRSELEYLDPAIIGTRINVQNGPLVKWKSVVTGFNTNRLLAIDYVEGAWTGKTAWRFEETAGGTKLIMEIDINCNRLWLKAISKVMNLSRMHSKQIKLIFTKLDKYLAANYSEYELQHNHGGISVSYIDFLTLAVKDINASEKFYRDVFRIENVTNGSTENKNEMLLKFGSQKIRLLSAEKASPIGKDEVIFRMALNTPLDRVKTILKEKGIEILPGPFTNKAVNSNNDIFFIKDPDGYLIALMQKS